MILTLIAIGILGFCLLVVQQSIYKRLWLKKLTVRIAFSTDHIFEGETGELKETIENRKRLPLAMLKVKFMTDRHLIFGSGKGSRTTDNYYRNDVFRVSGRERVIRTLKFQGGRRGYYTIKNISLVGTDLFFMKQMVTELPAATELYVYPKLYNSEALRRALIYLNGEMISKKHLLEDPFEFRGIREYQPYDDMRNINWKATAKTGDFKVNQRHTTSLRKARIFFNLQDDNIMRKEASVEMSLQVVAALCTFFMQQGMQVSCYGNGVDILTCEPVIIHQPMGDRDGTGLTGAGHLEYVYQTLARVDVSQPAVSFCETFGETVFEDAQETLTCFVAPNQYDDFVEILTQYQETGNPFVWFYPVQPGRQAPQLPPAVAGHISVIYPDE